MRKLLIVLLVFGLASVANATVLSWSTNTVSVGIGSSVVVQLTADDATGYDPKWVGADASTVAEISAISALTAAGPDSQVKDPAATTWAGWWTVMALDLDPTSGGAVAAGDHFDVTIDGLALGTYNIGADTYGTNDILAITVVPEPMTLMLLGLGGLFLRRRK